MALYDKASLVLIPSGTKEGTIFSQKPTNGDGDFTFSRSTSATRVGPSGYIEKETQNLLLQSNQFDTTWSPNLVSVTGGQSGYDGSSDAWLLQDTASIGEHRVRQSPSQYDVVTLSVYAKANTLNYLWLRGVNSGINVRAYFNLSTGTLGTSSGTLIDYNIESAGNGWYRCSLTLNQQSGFEYYIGLTDADGSASYIGTGSGSIYIQDAQLEQGLVARDYIETTTSAVYGGITDNVPRLDYTDSSCPALLLEPQRTNLVTHSEYFTETSNGTIDYNNTTSPEGLTNAILFTSNSSASSYIRSNTFAATDPTNVSVFVKYTNNQYIQLLLSGDADHYVNFDIQNGSIGTSGAQTSNETIENYGNGWYRISATFTGYTGSPTARIYLSNSSSAGFGGASSAIGKSVYVYGFQCEQSSYATSYIPTYGTSVTFESDTAINQANSNLPIGYPFSLFAEVDVVDTGSGYAVTLLNASATDRYYTIEYYSNVWHITARPNGVTARISSTSAPTLGTHKLLGIYTDSTMKLYLDGALIASGNNTETWNTDIDDLLLGQLRIGGDTGTRNPVREALIFNQELTNEEAIALTQV